MPFWRAKEIVHRGHRGALAGSKVVLLKCRMTRPEPMATISQLVDLLSEDLDIDLGTVRHVARNLREEGILPTGPRGGGQNTAAVDSLQAASLLIAVLGNAP